MENVRNMLRCQGLGFRTDGVLSDFRRFEGYRVSGFLGPKEPRGLGFRLEGMGLRV